MEKKIDLRNLTLPQLTDFMVGLGLPGKRAKHVFSWLQRPGITEISQMIDVKKDIRLQLAEHAWISKLVPEQVEQSQDGTVKYAFRLSDGALIESVLIPEGERYTLCLSSQCGCAMGCRFCLTGTMGLTRNLLPSEIVGQVIAVMEHMISQGVERLTPREFINNLVFMGMGEPLANYDNLIDALNILMDTHGLEFTERRVTVSTCGLVPRIRDLGRDVRVNLAISLHAAADETRNSLMPVNKTYPIDDLLEVCRSYPLSKKKVILIEYILIKGINDSADDARLLAEKLRGIPCRINLLPYNESEAMDFQCPDEETVQQFKHIVSQAGFLALIRLSRGADISAACGQLAGKSVKKPQ